VGLVEIGFLTSVTEALAAAVGAGMLLGGFSAGSAGVVFGWGRSELDRRVLMCGYVGGIVAVLLAAIDIGWRYAL
jgi:hypothetical protein